MHMWLSRNHLIIAPKWGVPNGNCMSDDTVEVIGLVPQCYEALSSTRKSLGTRLHTHRHTHTHYIPAHIHMHTHTHTCTHTYTHAHTCTHMHTHAHTCTHCLYTLTTYTHTHTHRYTTQPLQPWMKLVISKPRPQLEELSSLGPSSR